MCAAIAGLQDLREDGPIEITTFEMPCSVLVFQHTFSGVTRIVAVRSGQRGWVLVDNGIDASTVRQSAYNALPIYGTLYIKGDMTFNSTLNILKSINYIHTGTMTLGADGFVIGDATHFVRGCSIKLNEVDGVNKTPKAITCRNNTACMIHFNKIKTCDVGIYLSPIGTGCGENVFIGGWISNCNEGIDCNPAAPAGLWAQGNTFLASIYACSVSGIRLRGPAATDMQTFIGTSDNLVGGDPEFPAAGGGADITDNMYNNVFLMRFVRVAFTTLGLGSKLTNWYGDRFALTCISRNLAIAIGLNGVYGAATMIRDLSMSPRSILITWGGVFAGDTVDVAFQVVCAGGITATVIKSAVGVGTVALTEDEIFTLVNDSQGFQELDIWAKTDMAVTNVTVNVRVRR